MEGPTPVSALIHAATMVTAGVYMVARNAVLFEHAPDVMMIVAIVGVLTALMAATIGLVQTDIKRVLAYSTVSQLGYMFLATGVGAFAAAVFHLMTHAFFKALLFLGSGSVIHAVAGEQDMQRMGALRKFMPVTFVTMLIGTLAIAGIPPLSGFFSKDEILFRTFLENRILWALAALTALMTAFYMFRLMSMTFWGPIAVHPGSTARARDVPRGRGPRIGDRGGGARRKASGRPARTRSGAARRARGDARRRADAHPAWHGPHEAPGAMTVPLMALAVGTIVAGFIGIPPALGGTNAIEHFLAPSFVAHAPASHAEEQAAPAEHATSAAPHGESAEAPHMSTAGEIGLMLFSVLVAVAGILTARHFYVTKPDISRAARREVAGRARTPREQVLRRRAL